MRFWPGDPINFDPPDEDFERVSSDRVKTVLGFIKSPDLVRAVFPDGGFARPICLRMLLPIVRLCLSDLGFPGMLGNPMFCGSG